MALQPDQDVVDFLDAALIELTANTDLFPGKMEAVGPGIPARSVWVRADGGPPPLAYLQGGVGAERRFSAVQIMVRSAKDAQAAGLTLARQVRDTLHHQPLAGYIDVRAEESEPIYVAEENDAHHIWSLNFELWHEQ